MRFKTANGKWVQCCGQERLFRLPEHIRGQPLRSKMWPFDESKGGDLISIKIAPQKVKLLVAQASVLLGSSVGNKVVKLPISQFNRASQLYFLIDICSLDMF